jgi:hypothetical protein
LSRGSVASEVFEWLDNAKRVAHMPTAEQRQQKK